MEAIIFSSIFFFIIAVIGSLIHTLHIDGVCNSKHVSRLNHRVKELEKKNAELKKMLIEAMMKIQQEGED